MEGERFGESLGGPSRNTKGTWPVISDPFHYMIIATKTLSLTCITSPLHCRIPLTSLLTFASARPTSGIVPLKSFLACPKKRWTGSGPSSTSPGSLMAQKALVGLILRSRGGVSGGYCGTERVEGRNSQ